MKTTRFGKALWFLAVLLVVAVAGLALYTWGTLSFSYSSGDRVGYVQKFSKKGWICKTWEGELAMVTLPGAIPEKFYFSVRKDATANEINRLLGRRVKLQYSQHRGVPTTCFAETEYFVDDVKPVD
ncbi:MAG TPA: hypothetical protein VFE30_11325 [Anaeromyxobacteraceae bacterium]|nr:hypothetical protein [Anaeromyxobacteraceae bacterium]